MKIPEWSRYTILAVLALSSCEGQSTESIPNPVPLVTRVTPPEIPRMPVVELQVDGLGFVEGAEVFWNGTPVPTERVSGEILIATLVQANLSGAVGEVKVANPEPGGGLSAPVSVPVSPVHPTPSLTSILPSTADAVSTTQLELQLTGMGFVAGDAGTTALWGGLAVATAVVSDTEATALVPDYLLQTAGVVDVTVRNRGPGGGESAVLPFNLVNPVPVLTAVAPDEIVAAVGGTLELTGNWFVPGAVVEIQGETLPAMYLSATRLEAEVPGSILQWQVPATVTVMNPEPGGGASPTQDILVLSPAPSITALEPPAVVAMTGTGTLRIHGTGFGPYSTVSVGGTSKPLLDAGATFLDVSLASSDIEEEGVVEVEVANGSPGGGTSATGLTVLTRVPTIASLSSSHVMDIVSDFELRIFGSGFDPTSVVSIGGNARATMYVSYNEITADILATDVQSLGSIEVRVSNYGPSGGEDATSIVITSAADAAVAGMRGDSQFSRRLFVGSSDGAILHTQPISTFVYSMLDASLGGAPTVLYSTQFEIHELDLSSGELRIIVEASDDLRQPRYSADGQWIYFATLVDNGWEVWRVPSADGPEERLLFDPNGEDRAHPALSHSGDRLVYSVSGSDHSNLWIHDFDTGTSSPLGVTGATSRWTPDDQWIVYWSSGSLRAVRPNGTDGFQVAPTLVGAGFDISPDGNSLIAVRATNVPNPGQVVRISFPDGMVTPLSGLPALGSVAWFGP